MTRINSFSLTSTDSVFQAISNEITLTVRLRCLPKGIDNYRTQMAVTSASRLVDFNYKYDNFGKSNNTYVRTQTVEMVHHY